MLMEMIGRRWHDLSAAASTSEGGSDGDEGTSSSTMLGDGEGAAVTDDEGAAVATKLGDGEGAAVADGEGAAVSTKL